MKTAHRTVVSLVEIAILVALVVVPSFWAFSQIKAAADKRKHTFILIHTANRLMSSLIDAETGQRGYLLTGNEAFLEPFFAVRDSISDQLKKLRQISQISAGQRQLDALPRLINAKLAYLAHNIELKRNNNMTAVLSNIRGNQGKQLMDSIRAEMTSLIQIEEGALAQHDIEFHSKMRLLFIIITIASLFLLLFALSFVYSTYRETQQRLKNLVHLETQHLLEVQEGTNKQLQQANVTLQVSEEQLAVTLHSIGDAVIATDVQGLVTLLNPLAEQFTGWTQAEATGRPVDEIFHIINQKTRQPATIPVKETLAHGTIQGLTNHTILLARDGNEFVIADSCAPIRDRDGQVVGAVLVFRDVTEEYARQQALHDNSTLIQTILNTVVDGIITLHASGGIIETVNPAAERMFGHSAAELIGKNFSLLIPELDRDQRNGNGSIEYYSASDEARASGLGREVVGRRKDGSSFPLEIAVSEMSLDGQRHFTGILRDITARKQVEAEQKLLSQRLRDHQFYTRSLFEANIDALMTTDPSGIITDVNKQMEELTGCTRDELIGAPFRSYFTDPEQAEASVKLVLSEKKVTNYELTARARDGRETVVSLNATTFYDRDRKLQGVFAAARDVTERKRLDQVLQEKNVELENARFVAEKANLAKSEFLSSMSHELRSPLNAILGFAQLLESASPPPTPAQNESLAQILQAGWHLLKLIDEILDLAKVESKQLPLSREPVSLAEVMLECRGMIEPQAQQRGIRMTFPQFDIPYFVLADRIRVKQVIINLLSNAIKYNIKDGTVEVDCSESTPGSIRVSIRDTGAGLYPEQRAQLFQAFNRLGQDAGGEEGTGIGLVVAKRLVELMGGEIGVESTVGVGSVFWFELIACAEPQLSLKGGEAAALVQPPVPRGAGPHTLLYVEDNPANLKLVEQIIARQHEIRLLTAVNGNSGIEIARLSRPDVILMDINLPGINGFDALEILRADQATAHIPVIAISANAMPLDIERGLKAGFFRYIIKPIKVNEFMAALDMALEFAGKKPGKTK